MNTNCPLKSTSSALVRWDTNQKKKIAAQQQARDKAFQAAVKLLWENSHPNQQLTPDQDAKLRFLGEHAHLFKFENGEIKTLGDDPHLFSNNLAMFNANSELALDLALLCKGVLLAEQIERGIIANRHYGQQYLSSHPRLEKTIGIVGVAHLGLSLTHTLHSIYTLYKAAKTDNAVFELNAILDVAQHGSDFLGDVMEKADMIFSLPSVMKVLGNVNIAGGAATVFSFVSAGLSAATQIRSWADDGVSNEIKILGGIEAAAGGTGKILSSASTAVWLYRARKAAEYTTQGKHLLAAKFASNSVPVIGAAISALALSLIVPLQVHGIKKEYDYAKVLGDLDNEFKSLGYPGLLAELYKDKGLCDSVNLAAQTILTTIGGGSSIALMSGVITAPVGIAIGLLTTALSVALEGTKQTVLDQIALRQRRKIEAWEKANGNQNYYLHALDAYHDLHKNPMAQEAETIQRDWDVDQVVNITQRKSDNLLRELAGLTQMGERILSGKVYIDVFRDGRTVTEKNTTLDHVTGIINLNDNIKQVVRFTQPLLAAGQEQRVRDKSGKNTFKTTIEMVARNGWKINDNGSAHTQIDLTNVVQRIKLKNSSVRTATLTANMGLGDDLVIANSGDLIINGGLGNNTVDYRKLAAGSSITVNADQNNPGNYTVVKSIKNSKTLEEVILERTDHNGKKKEIVEYRDTTLTTESFTSTDHLTSIQRIVGSQSDDIFNGGEANEYFRPEKGNDIGRMRGGDDVVEQGIFEADYDFFCGGDGNNTLDYSSTQSIALIRNNVSFNGTTHIEVKLMGDDNDPAGNTYISTKEGKIKKLASGQPGNKNRLILLGTDTVKHFQNLIGTVNHDFIHMDNESNIVNGFGGDDRIYTYGGDDTVLLGKGNSHVNLGSGDDLVLLALTTDSHRIEGDTGHDTVNYALTNLALNPRKQGIWDLGNIGIQADLKAGTAIKFTDGKRLINLEDEKKVGLTTYSGQIADTLVGIESITATDLNDVVLGDRHDNTIRTLGGNDEVNAREGNDILELGYGDDTGYGGSGDDVFVQYVNLDSDTLDGGEDFDIADYSTVLTTDERQKNEAQTQTAGIVASLENGIVKKTVCMSDGSKREATDTLVNIEGLVGTQADDTLTGDDNDNLLDGADGHDILDALSGNNILVGAKGNDTLKAGVGNDTYRFSSDHGLDTIEDAGGSDDMIAFESPDLLASYSIKRDDGLNDLVFFSQDNHHSVTIRNQFLTNGGDRPHAIEKLKIGDTLYSLDKLIEVAAALSSSSSGTYFSTRLNAIEAEALSGAVIITPQ